MATYVFNVLKDQLANGYLHLDDATRDGSTITGDNTHTPVTGVFRACLIAPSSTLVTSGTDNTVDGTTRDAVDVTDCSQIQTLNELNVSGHTGMAAGNETDNDWTTATLTKVTGASGYTKWVVPNLTITSVASGSTINGILIVWDKNTGSNDLATKIPLVWIGLGTNVDTNGGDIGLMPNGPYPSGEKYCTGGKGGGGQGEAKQASAPTTPFQNATSGTANTGGGGGAVNLGYSNGPQTGGTGGSGLVVVVEPNATVTVKDGVYNMKEQYHFKKLSKWT